MCAHTWTSSKDKWTPSHNKPISSYKIRKAEQNESKFKYHIQGFTIYQHNYQLEGITMHIPKQDCAHFGKPPN
jgi:hypothetical protein